MRLSVQTTLLAVLLLSVWEPQAVLAQAAYVPGEVIVKLRPGTPAEEFEETLAEYGCTVKGRVPALDLLLLSAGEGLTAEELVREMASEPYVEFAHLNYLGQGGFVPSDTHFGQQWHHQNTGQTGGTAGADIQSVDAWDITRGSASVVVAVLDTGIDGDHPEFAGRILPGFDFVNEDGDPEADHPHGAQVTGLLAANANNAFGVAGVDHFCSIRPVKVLDQNNAGTTFDLIQGLNFAATSGADVISMSLINYPNTPSLQMALQNARDAGAILIACAGNGGIGNADVSMPGASPLTISVGATDHNDVRAGFSGTGAALDVVAPGLADRTILFGSSADSFSSFSGCSAATPVAAGVASLALSVDGSLTHDQMRQILIDGAEDQVGSPAEDTAGRDDFYGFGRINALNTLCQLDDEDPQIACPADVTAECSATGGTPAGDPQLAAFLSGASASDDLDPDPDLADDAPSFFPVSASTPVEFTATDKCGKDSACTAFVSVVDTTAPDIDCPTNVTVECNAAGGVPAADPQLAPFFAGVSATDACDAGPGITHDAPAVFPVGPTVVTFTATDDGGNAQTCSAVVMVADTQPPQITVSLDPAMLWPPNHRMVGVAASVQVSDVCDPSPGFALASITSNEPDEGRGDGSHPGDVQGAAFGTPDLAFQLRAERSGRGSGRVYEVLYTAADGSGNAAQATAQVTVPHNK